jgi:hypothetical protein
MLSTHWRDTHEPTDGGLRALDILARQAVDMLAQKRTEAMLEAERQRMLKLCPSTSDS